MRFVQRYLATLIILSAAALAAAAGTVTFTADDSGTFGGTIRIDGGSKLMEVDLSALGKDAEVFRAELALKVQTHYLHTPPVRPTKVYPEGRPDKPLTWVKPAFVSLDATEAVREAVAGGTPLKLILETTGYGIERLEVSCGRAKTKAAIPAVTGLKVVRHRGGQSILTFTEPKLAEFPEFNKGAEVSEFARKLRADHPGMTFRLWRSGERITPATIARAVPVARVGLMTAWNGRYWADDTGKQPPVRYRVSDGGEEVPWGTGIVVHNPEAPGKAFYAVTVSVDGQEDFGALAAGNTTDAPIEETVGAGEPVLQWVEKPAGWMYRNAVKDSHLTRLIYTRWERWPNSPVPGEAHDYLVAIPMDPPPAGGAPDNAVYDAYRADPAPVGLHLHCWGGSLNGGYVWWLNAHRGAVLIASNQVPYDWWTGHHERRNNSKTWADGQVRPFTTNRLFSFLDWAATQHAKAPEAIRAAWPKLDLTRVFTSGGSMGGAGSPMIGIRFGDRIAWSLGHVGVHVPAMSPQFKSSYEGSYGPRNDAITTPDGKRSPWDWYNDDWWLRQYPRKETAFIMASNGKNDGAIGWPQAVLFFKALQETRRPHMVNWAMGGHGTRTIIEQNFNLDIRTDQTLPAFTRCSLDDDFGTAAKLDADQLAKAVAAGKHVQEDPFDGDSAGQVNRYLWWKTDDVVDRPDRWEMTVILQAGAPKDACTVDLTPRRCQAFKVTPGAAFTYTVTGPDGKTAAPGQAAADELGLLTLKQIPLAKGENRVKIVAAR